MTRSLPNSTLSWVMLMVALLFTACDSGGESSARSPADSGTEDIDARAETDARFDENDMTRSIDATTVAPSSDMAMTTLDDGVSDLGALGADAALIDAERPVDMMVSPMRVPCDLTIALTSPSDSSFAHIDDDIRFSGTVQNTDGSPGGGLLLQLIDHRERLLGQTTTDDFGEFSITLSAELLGQAPLSVEPVVVLDEGFCGPQSLHKIYRCLQTYNATFDTRPENWTLFGDATWDSRGWFEMTGIQNGRKGAVYNDIDAISSGRASIEFVMSTGGGTNGGADGFALTIIDIANAEELATLINGASSGGGLGYAVAPPFGREDYSWVGEAITVEIDTWYNDFTTFRDTMDPNRLDPTRSNHIAVTRNGNPGDHVVWFPVPTVEDLMPHIVRVDLLGDSIRISYDGDMVIEESIQFAFKGGYMFFSGSTGWATNYHRFDNLDILSNCF